MEDRLVTIAIHTYERALIIKSILETEGLEVYLHNVNLIQPVISSGVRIRIKESDLPAALMILEKLNFPDDNEVVPTSNQPRTILVPVDFSLYSIKSARLAMQLGKELNASVTLLHTYYSPIYTGGLPISDAFILDDSNANIIENQQKLMYEQMDKLTGDLKSEVKSNLLPDIEIITKFREGIPEEQIHTYSKRHTPLLIIMGTHGIGSKDGDLIGSVTADVIDRSRVPVFAYPEALDLTSFHNIKRIGFLTSFEQRDLIAFESMMQLLKPYTFKIYFLRMTTDADAWDEIKLNGIKAYFSQQYPEMDSSYCVIKGEKLMSSLEEFIQERQLDLIAMPSQKRSIFSRLFNSSLASKMLFHTQTPVLVFKG